MENVILSVNHLSKSFGAHKVLADVDFEVKKGDVVSIIGASGSGKSTLLRCINLLETPSAGEIIYRDKNVLDRSFNPNKYRANVGMVFQSFNLFFNMTVLENCMVGQQQVLGRNKQEAKEKAMYYLEKVGMAPYIQAKPRQLSGGQKQRVGIARAIMQQPKLILCDEPIASLDPKASKVIMDQLKEINESKKITCIVNLHQVDVAMKYSERIIGVSGGKIVYDGLPENLNQDMIHRIYQSKSRDLITDVSGGTNEK